MNRTEKAEQLARDFLALLNRNAPVEDYLKYLPDGDFEQWSYPEVEIKNLEHLKGFFAQTWGMIKSQNNEITTITSRELESGRIELEVSVNWSAETATGQKFARPLHYQMTIMDGSSSGDPVGQFPKIMRYKMTRG
ncbi:MAG: hypothetical protein QM523_06255 [Candidatus Pacebacteria bacterium]|nr:hypothetical protein [Candidatus Paceibacterota bacterium]